MKKPYKKKLKSAKDEKEKKVDYRLQKASLSAKFFFGSNKIRTSAVKKKQVPFSVT